MEVGSISIVGKLDVSSINDSLSQLNSGFGKVKDIAKNSFGDISNLSKSLGGITKGLVGIGLAAGTAMVGLAAVGPYTAGAMARINVTMGELGRTLSGALAPAFETFADLLSDVSTWLSSPDGTAALSVFNGVLNILVDSLGKVGEFAGIAFSALEKLGTNFEATFGIKLEGFAKWLADNFGFAGAGAALGFMIAGPAGAMALGGTAFMGDQLNKQQKGEDNMVEGNVVGGMMIAVVEGFQALLDGDWNDMIAGSISGMTGISKEDIYDSPIGVNIRPDGYGQSQATSSNIGPYPSEYDFFKQTYDKSGMSYFDIGDP